MSYAAMTAISWLPVTRQLAVRLEAIAEPDADLAPHGLAAALLPLSGGGRPWTTSIGAPIALDLDGFGGATSRADQQCQWRAARRLARRVSGAGL